MQLRSTGNYIVRAEFPLEEHQTSDNADDIYNKQFSIKRNSTLIPFTKQKK
jgi:hypothetical protein